MPGIYVRKASWFDWTQKRENPDLRVPASYWLCHKNNVYKFIFRYHRTTRNAKQFNFGRELMKVIRKIIKNQPRQGQQFCTRHLLVTYNHASWTRQDKMFAMTKFKQRSVSAFSHAFVLTIKLSCPLESIDQDAKYTETTPHADQCLIRHFKNSNNSHIYENKNERKNKKCLIHFSKSDVSEKNIQCNNTQGQIAESKNHTTQSDNNLIANNLKKTFIREFINQEINDGDTSTFITNSKVLYKLPIMHSIPSENQIKFNDKIKESKSLEHDIIKLKEKNEKWNINNKNSTLWYSNTNAIKEEKIAAHQPKDFICLERGNIKDEKLSVGNVNVNIESLNDSTTSIVLDKFGSEMESSECNPYLVSHNLNDNNTINVPNVDSANLPYQYLIEEEIENTKHKMPNLKTNLQKTESNIKSCNQDEQNLKKYKIEHVNEKIKQSTNCVEIHTPTTRTQDLPYSKRRKCIVDNMASRSSDITDLVMEGLMFTIRQGKDTVAVIEQETKLEMDEVLENSEKIETKEGEKCLRNSSLLRLEDLVTMIELPKQTKTGHARQNAIIQEHILKNQSLNKHLFNGIKHSFINNSIKKESIIPKVKHMQLQSSCNETSLASTSFLNIRDNENSDLTNKGQYLAVYDNYKCEQNMNSTENTNSKYQKEKKEKEEDIVSEILQNNIFQANKKELTKFEKRNSELNPSLSKKLLSEKYLDTDYLNNKILIKSDEEIPIKSIINKSHELHKNNMIFKSKYNNAKKDKSNVPIVISNQAITVDEIPLSIQKVFKNKLSTKHVSLDDKNEINKDNIDHKQIYKIQSCQKEGITCNIQSETKFLENDNDYNNDENKSMSSTVPKVKLQDISISETNLKMQETKSQKQNIYTDKVEEMSSNKIQDITPEFYQGISYLQKRKNLTNQNYLKSNTKSLNIVGDTNNDEIHVEMVKLFQDITRGAKVVVRRISKKQCS